MQLVTGHEAAGDDAGHVRGVHARPRRRSGSAAPSSSRSFSPSPSARTWSGSPERYASSPGRKSPVLTTTSVFVTFRPKPSPRRAASAERSRAIGERVGPLEVLLEGRAAKRDLPRTRGGRAGSPRPPRSRGASGSASRSCGGPVPRGGGGRSRRSRPAGQPWNVESVTESESRAVARDVGEMPEGGRKLAAQRRALLVEDRRSRRAPRRRTRPSCATGCPGGRSRRRRRGRRRAPPRGCRTARRGSRRGAAPSRTRGGSPRPGSSCDHSTLKPTVRMSMHGRGIDEAVVSPGRS